MECTIGLVAISGLCGVSSRDFLASSVICFLISTVTGGFSALVLLRYYKWLPCDDFFALLDITFLGVVDLSVVAFFLEMGLLPGRQDI